MTAPGSPPSEGREPSRSTRLSPRASFQQPSSLAGFAGCRLTPGWYRSDSRAAIAKRFAYQSGVPGVGIGNAFCRSHASCRQGFLPQRNHGDAALGDFWDHGLMINDALWDSWFASSLAAALPALGARAGEELKTVLQQAFSTDASSNRASGIANRRFMPDLQGKPSGSCRRRTRQDGRGLQACLQVPHRRRRIQCQLHLPARLGSHPAGAQRAQNPLFQKREAFRARQLPRRPFPVSGGQQRQVPRGRLRLDRGDPGHPGRGGHGVVGPRGPEATPRSGPWPGTWSRKSGKGALPEHVRLCQPPPAER